MHKTNDMALVSYLKVLSHTPQEVIFEGQTCYWYFTETDGLMDAIDVFGAGDAMVEPREYNKHFAHTKREFWQAKEAYTG